MRILKKYAIYLIIVFVGLKSYHNFHVSLIQIDYNKESKRLQIAIKMFTNDVERRFVEMAQTRLNIGQADENIASDSLLLIYIKQNFELRINGQKDVLKMQFVEKKMKDDALWVYVSTENVKTLKHLEVRCTLLTDIFFDQTNMVIINESNTMLLSNNNTVDSVDF